MSIEKIFAWVGAEDFEQTTIVPATREVVETPSRVADWIISF